jgi:hypothetical protein
MLADMETAHPVAARQAQQSRLGRRVLVVSDLADLRGPAEGMAELPVRLFWSSPDRTFYLGKPFMVRSM